MADKIGSILYEASIDPKGVQSGAKVIQGELGGLKTGFQGLSSTLATLGIAISGVVVAKAFINFLKESVTSANESNRVLAQTEAVIRSTGGAAQLSAQQISQMAKEIQKTTPISDEAAQTGMNMLLTFTKVGKEVFPEATQAMVDMATAMNGGLTPDAAQLSDTAIRLGKALQDPVQGVTALRRVGVNFNDMQIKMIQTMVDAGDRMKAQKYILAELSKEFGGSATAQAKTFQGQMLQLGNQFDDFKEIVGNSLIPALSYLISSFSGIGAGINVLLVPIRGMATGMILLTATAKELGIALSTIFSAMVSAIKGDFSGAVDKIKSGFANMQKEGNLAAKNITAVWNSENQKQGDGFKALMNSEVDEQSEASKKKAKDLEDETEKFNDEMAKRKKTFEQNLADTIWAHQDKVKSIEKDMSDENADFKTKMSDRVDEFKASMDEMVASHKKKVDEINKSMTDEKTDTAEKNAETLADAKDSIAEEKKAYDKKITDLQTSLDKEVSRGKNASQTKINLIKQEIQETTDAYDEKTTKINADADKEVEKANKTSAKKLADLSASLQEENDTYAADVIKKTEEDAKETLRLKQTHDQRLTDYQTSLDAENKILSDHQAEVDSIKNKARVDDITRLQQQYADENAEATKQHLKRMADIQGEGVAEGLANTGALATGISAGTGNVTNAAKNLASQTKSALSTGGGGSWGDKGRSWISTLIDGISNAANASKSWFSSVGSTISGWISSNIHFSIPHFASGVENFKGGVALVGENGPELVRLPQGADVIPNNVAFGGNRKSEGGKGVNQTISIHIDKMTDMSDIDALGREIGFKASLLPN